MAFEGQQKGSASKIVAFFACRYSNQNLVVVASAVDDAVAAAVVAVFKAVLPQLK